MRAVRSGNFLGPAVLVALAGLALVWVPAAGGQGKASSEASFRAQFLVFPFENRSGDPRLEWLSEGLEELTIGRLSASGQHVYTHEGRATEVERYGLPMTARISRATMLRLATDLDADYVIFGSYTSDGKNLSVDGRLLRVTPAALEPATRESGPLDSLMDLDTRVVWRLLSTNDRRFPLTLEEFSRAQSPLRLDAFEHFVRGHSAVDDEVRVRELKQAVALEPNWPEPAFALGKAYSARHDCSTAIVWFGRVPKNNSRYVESLFASGVCRVWLGQPDRAEEAFLSLQELVKNAGAGVPEILNNLAIARERNGKVTAARADLARAAELDPQENDYPFNLGLLALRAGDIAGSAAYLREAVKRQPDDPESRAVLIYALERSGQKAEAQGEREAAAEIPGLLPLPGISAETLANLDRLKTELDTATLMLEMEGADLPVAEASHPDAGAAGHDHAGRQQLAAGRLDDAQREFRAALATDAHDPAAHRGLAEIAHRRQRLDEAVAEYRASLDARDSATVRLALARVYLEQKKVPLAREELEKAVKLAPNYTEAKQLLERLGGTGQGAPK